MALPASGAISLQDIEDEFGGSGSISISEYYSADSGVPASGTISFSDFHGTSAVVEPEFNRAVYSASASNDSFGSSVTATASIIVANTGTISATATPSGTATGGNYENQGEVVEADYDVRLSKNSGDSITTGSQGVWQSLSTTRTYRLARTGTSGTSSGNYTLSIRNATTLATVDTATVNLTAEINDLS